MKIKNQFIIKTSKDTQEYNYVNLMDACKTLNGSALKLFIYFNGFGPDQEFDFFPKIFCENYGVSMSAEKNAFGELLQAGYLKQIDTNIFLFSSIKN